MQQFEWIHAAWLAIAIVLEIIANVFLKFSDGFRRKIYGILSLAAVLGAFSALSQAVKGIDLSVAYALWGGFGIAATIAAGWVLFGQRLNNKGWAGLILPVAGMALIKLASRLAACKARRQNRSSVVCLTQDQPLADSVPGDDEDCACSLLSAGGKFLPPGRCQ